MLEWRHPLLVWLKILDLTADEQEKKKKKKLCPEERRGLSN